MLSIKKENINEYYKNSQIKKCLNQMIEIFLLNLFDFSFVISLPKKSEKLKFLKIKKIFYEKKLIFLNEKNENEISIQKFLIYFLQEMKILFEFERVNKNLEIKQFLFIKTIQINNLKLNEKEIKEISNQFFLFLFQSNLNYAIEKIDKNTILEFLNLIPFNDKINKIIDEINEIKKQNEKEFETIFDEIKIIESENNNHNNKNKNKVYKNTVIDEHQNKEIKEILFKEIKQIKEQEIIKTSQENKTEIKTISIKKEKQNEYSEEEKNCFDEMNLILLLILLQHEIVFYDKRNNPNYHFVSIQVIKKEYQILFVDNYMNEMSEYQYIQNKLAINKMIEIIEKFGIRIEFEKKLNEKLQIEVIERIKSIIIGNKVLNEKEIYDFGTMIFDILMNCSNQSIIQLSYNDFMSYLYQNNCIELIQLSNEFKYEISNICEDLF